ncbi:allene oxide synthase 1, chloroplastic-like [Olea europaea var. sylvestris]|uniref:Allene oxide synthase 1, chloroplastic n=1 Tax=Olea europaea subsp. europaea TaxID=158383 RepID=A0A8S0RV80_OLEEU|nr:allene oxide synthase 1, chloroplastic-like [Olea europaea var. sylvestris]CAA2982935.1 allene oxide synthase 1, chloroplastic [Olea europaea subsp. europaea]
MASSSLTFSPLHLQFPSSKLPPSKPFKFESTLHPIKASVSEKQSIAPPAQLPSTPPATVVVPELKKLPIRKIPGNYGLPFIGPYIDRQDYFYNQGRYEFFRSRIQKFKSTVFRTNMPPGPLISSSSKVIVLLDGKSFPVLFDTDKVEKKDLFTGTFMPSTELTGGYRVLSYLDPSEPSHAKLKQVMFFLLSSRRDKVIPEFQNCYTELFENLERDLSSQGKASFSQANDQAAFNFLARSLYGANPADSNLGSDGPNLVSKWVLFQLHPLLSLGLPRPIEDGFLHNFSLPPFLIKKDYQRLYDFFYQNSTPVLDQAEKMGVSRDEACHNLLFATCFNSFGGMKFFFPNMLKWVGRAGLKLHTKLAEEIRSVIKSNGGKITMAAMERMPLMKSTVYEALRIEPPVPSQYAKAKRDFIIESHDAAFRIKEGEILFGFQPFATKDSRIFDRSEEFLADRFVGENGEKLLKHVVWSNGPETERSTINNKQCVGKDFVVLVSRLLLVEMFLRYDSFDIEVAPSPLGASVTLSSLKRASF